MDIVKIGNLHKINSFSSGKIDKGSEFKQVLDQKISETSGPSKNINIGIKNDIVEQGDKIMNLLDEYARELADPLRTLKDIEPLIKDIEKEIDFIESKIAKRAHNDDGLEGIVQSLAVTANAAVFKFYRGDYI